MNRINIAGIMVDNLDMEQACRIANEFIQKSKVENQENKIKIIQSINTDFIVKANISEEVASIANCADLALPDGMPVVWASRLLKKSLKERIGGPDFFENFNKVANMNKYSYYFLGSTHDTVKKLIIKLNEKYPDIRIAGYECPPFSDMKCEDDNICICERINMNKPDVVWVSFGCPKQEWWIVKNKDHINASIISGIGAAFEFYAGNLKRAPPIMQRCGLEWFFRLLQEPKRLWKRYLIQGPIFVKYCLKHKNNKLLGITEKAD